MHVLRTFVRNPANNLGTLDRWTLLKELGTGATSRVFLAIDPKTNKHVAIKIFVQNKEISLNLAKAESCIMRSFNHSNILHFVELYESIKFRDPKSGQVLKVTAIVMEYASQGELFSVLSQVGRFTEECAKVYFLQILNAIEYMHKNGIVHRDLKLENVLLDHKDAIKLADFGFSSKVSGQELFRSPVGTSVYFAPEIHENHPYSGEAADLFAAGMILFALICGHMPFSNAHHKDEIYTFFYTDEQEVFWEVHENMMNKKVADFKFSSEFKDMVSKMFDTKPHSRPTIKDLREHPWLNSKLRS